MPDAPLDPPRAMNNLQLRAGAWISGVALVVLALHVIAPDRVTLDQGTLVVLAIAALPWLTLFFKRFTITGLVDAESQDRSQGSTSNPLPPAPQVATQAEFAPAPSPAAKKVLATLGRYQHQIFPNDRIHRWTFGVHPSSPEYADFLTGVAETVRAGWVAVSPRTHHCMLTNEGLSYVENHGEIRESRDFYAF